MKIVTRSCIEVLTHGFSSLEPLLVVSSEFLTELGEFWVHLKHGISLRLVEKRTWVDQEISVDSSVEEIAHHDLASVTDHPFSWSEGSFACGQGFLQVG